MILASGAAPWIASASSAVSTMVLSMLAWLVQYGSHTAGSCEVYWPAVKAGAPTWAAQVLRSDGIVALSHQSTLPTVTPAPVLPVAGMPRAASRVAGV